MEFKTLLVLVGALAIGAIAAQLACRRTMPATEKKQAAASETDELFPAAEMKGADLLWGYINRRGQFVIAPRFTSAEGFSSGLAAVGLEGNALASTRLGYIDHSGKIAFELSNEDRGQLSFGTQFHDGLLFTGSRYIDREGNVAFDKRGEFGKPFSEGRAVFTMNSERENGFIDREGKVAIEARFYRVQQFSEGLATVALRMDTNALSRAEKRGLSGPIDQWELDDGSDVVPYERNVWGVIDENGSWVLEPGLLRRKYGDLEEIGEFHEGLALLVPTNGQIGYLRRDGSFLSLADEIDSFGAQSFAEGFAGASPKSSRFFGFIDTTGAFRIKPSYVQVKPFSGGLAAALDDDKGWGYIGTDGEWKIPPQFDGADPFRDGLAKVHRRLKTLETGYEAEISYIDASGRVVHGWKEFKFFPPNE